MNLMKDLWRNRSIIFNLARNDFKNKFSGSYLGVFWAFVQPIVIVLIYWFVFQKGLKATPIQDFPYVLWLIAGICPWFFFNDAMNAAANSLFDYSYIVKKVSFKISILPMVKILSVMFVHLFFIVLVIVIYLLYGQPLSIYMLQAIYYTFCTFMLALGFGYLISSIAVFFKDLIQIVNIILQFGMWLTPIMYSDATFGAGLKTIMKLNPMYYVVSGYRDSFIYHVGFWTHYKQTIYFWTFTAIVFILGTIVYKKLKPHFSDVL